MATRSGAQVLIDQLRINGVDTIFGVPGESYLAALDQATGKTLWMLPRRTKTTAYSTPVIHSPEAGKAQLILNSQAHGIYAIEPHSGRVAWEVSDVFDKRSVSSPVVAGELILGSCGSGGGGNFVALGENGMAQRRAALAGPLRRSCGHGRANNLAGVLRILKQDRDHLVHGNGIVLIFARTETQTFHECVWGVADAVLWIKGRLTFYNVDGTKPKNSGGAPSVLIAYGKDNADRLRTCRITGRVTAA